MSRGHIDLRVEEAIARLTFRGRGDLNLLSRDLFLEMAEALDRLGGRPDARTVLLEGHGERAFSAGVDVREMKEYDPPRAEAFIRALHLAMQRIMGLPQPVIACIRGPCLGGGLELAMACDLRVAADDALFGLPEIRVGIPSVIEASLLPYLIGWGPARELILTGETIQAREALRLGLVTRLVPPVDLEREALVMARGFLSLSPRIVSVQKEILHQWMNLGQRQAAEHSIKAFALCFATDHPREGMDAFLEKRRPRFSDT